VVMVFVVVVMV